MMGIETIRNISNVAAYRAAEEGKYPLTVVDERDVHHIPFLGDYVPAGWRKATWADVETKPRNVWYSDPGEDVTFMVDSSGFGGPGEPALTFDEFAEYALSSSLGWAIDQSGQFQVYVTGYVRDATSPGVPAPDVADVECSECGEIHDDLEECDPSGLQERCDHENVSEDEVFPEGIYFGAKVVHATECRDCGARLVPGDPDEDGNVTWEVEW